MQGNLFQRGAQATIATIRLIAGELSKLSQASARIPAVPGGVFASYEALQQAAAKAANDARQAGVQFGSNSVEFQRASRQANALADQLRALGQAGDSSAIGLGNAQGAVSLIANLASNSQGGLANLLVGVTGVSSGLFGVAAGFGAAMAAGSLFYSTLLSPAEQFNRQILANRAIIASFVDILDSQGNRLTDPKAKIEAQAEDMRRILLKLEKDAQNIPGVTTATLNEIYSGVVSNIAFVLNQTRGSSKDIQTQLQEVAVGFAAASSIMGISGAELQQVITGLFSNNFTNDNTLITRLGFTKEGIDQARATGTQLQYIQQTLQPLITAAELGSNSVEALAVNFQDLYENLTRLAGENIVAPIAKPLGEMFKFLTSPDIKAGLEEFFKSFGDKLGEGIDNLVAMVKAIADIPGVQATANMLIKDFGAVLSFAWDALQLTIRGITQLAEWLEALQKWAMQIPVIKGMMDGLSNSAGVLGNTINFLRGALQGLTGVSAANAEALATYSANIGRLKKEAVSLQTRIQALIAAGADDSNKELKMLKQQLKDILAEAKKNEKDAKGLSLTSKEEIDAVAHMSAEVKALGTEMENLVPKTQLVLKVLPDIGTAAEVIGLRWQNLVREFNSPVNTAQLAKTNEQLAKMAVTAYSLGQVKLEDLQKQLQAIITDTRSGNPESSLEAYKALLSIYELELNSKKKLLEIDRARNALLVSSGQLFAEEASVNDLAVKYKELTDAVENAEAKIKAAKLIGNTQDVRIATAELERLRVELDKVKFDSLSAQYKANMASIERSVQKVLQQSSMLASQRIDERQTALGQIAVAEASALDAITDNRNKLFTITEQLKLLEAQKPVTLQEQFELEQKIAKLKQEQLQTSTQLVQIQARAEVAYRQELLGIQTQQYSMLLSSFDRQQKFLQASTALEKAQLDQRKLSIDLELGRYAQVATLQQLVAQEAEKSMSEQEKADKAKIKAEREAAAAQFARFALAEQGVPYAFNEEAMAKRKFELAKQQAQIEREAAENKLKADQASLELAIQKQQLEAESKLNEAQQKALDAEIKLVDLQKQADQARKAGDADALALIEKQIALQQNVIGLTQAQVARSNQGVADADLLGKAQRTIFAVNADNEARRLQQSQNSSLQNAQIEAIRGGAFISYEPVRAPLINRPQIGANATQLNTAVRQQASQDGSIGILQSGLAQTNQLVQKVFALLEQKLGNQQTINNNFTTPPDPRMALRILGL